jgi:hypothetical protein
VHLFSGENHIPYNDLAQQLNETPEYAFDPDFQRFMDNALGTSPQYTP